MKKHRLAIILFLLPTVLLFLLVYGYPIATVIVTSFFSWKASSPLEFVGLGNYIKAFTADETMLTSFVNTGIWVLLQSTVHVCIGVTFAYILSRKRRGWKFFRTAFMIPNVISMSALGLIFLNIFNPEYGLINALVRPFMGQDFYHVWYFDTSTAFFTVTLSWLLYAGLISVLALSGIMSVPEEVLEAAVIDGASGFQIDMMVTFPLLRTTLGTAIILAATSMLREFELIYLTTNGGPGSMTMNLPLYLYKTAVLENNYGYANMIGTTLIVLGILAVILINKVFRMNESDY